MTNGWGTRRSVPPVEIRLLFRNRRRSRSQRQSPLPRRPLAANAASAYGSQARRKSGGGWFGKFVLLLVLAAVGGFVCVMVHFNESPQKAVQRLVRFVQVLAARKQPEQASSAPVSTPVPKAISVSASMTPAPEASAAPVASASATPTPVDPIAW